MPQLVFCETVELAAEATALAHALGISVATELSADPLDAAAHRQQEQAGVVGALLLSLPSPERAVSALHVCSDPRKLVVGAIADADGTLAGLLADLGFVCVRETEATLCALALLTEGGTRAFHASARRLNALDRLRLSSVLAGSEKSAGRLQSLGADGLAFQSASQERTVRLGSARATRSALAALQAVQRPSDERPLPFSAPANLEVSRDILFGPSRLLSDPASKAALVPFDLPMPQEELCTSPSRAAIEAARIGFPVRISLASPDLRVWDFPDLSVDGVDNAARVRDVYRQLTVTAESRAASARVLGVTVTATTLASALLRVSARPLPEGHVLFRIGFCDPHGAVSKDAISTAMPLSEPAFANALARLRGRDLLGDARAARREGAEALTALCTKLASFVHAFRREVALVELHPVALLVGGGAEVREAAIQVTDAFVRDLGS